MLSANISLKDRYIWVNFVGDARVVSELWILNFDLRLFFYIEEVFLFTNIADFVRFIEQLLDHLNFLSGVVGKWDIFVQVRSHGSSGLIFTFNICRVILVVFEIILNMLARLSF